MLKPSQSNKFKQKCKKVPNRTVILSYSNQSQIKKRIKSQTKPIGKKLGKKSQRGEIVSNYKKKDGKNVAKMTKSHNNLKNKTFIKTKKITTLIETSNIEVEKNEDSYLDSIENSNQIKKSSIIFIKNIKSPQKSPIKMIKTNPVSFQKNSTKSDIDMSIRREIINETSVKPLKKEEIKIKLTQRKNKLKRFGSSRAARKKMLVKGENKYLDLMVGYKNKNGIPQKLETKYNEKVVVKGKKKSKHKKSCEKKSNPNSKKRYPPKYGSTRVINYKKA